MVNYRQNLSTYVPGLMGQDPYSTVTQSKFFNENPYRPDRGLTDYAAGVGSMGRGFLNSQNPYGAGGALAGGPLGAANRWGFNLNYPDINDPRTVSTTGKWMNNMAGGLQNTFDAAQKQMAGASIAQGRYGVRGGVDPMAASRQQAYDTVAGQYGQNFDRAVQYQQNKAAYDAGLWNQYAGGLADVYKAQLGAGTGLMGDQLQALLGLNQGAEAERARRFGAYTTDVNNKNNLMLQIPELLRQQAQWNNNEQNRQTQDWMRRDLYNTQGQLRNQLTTPGYYGNADKWVTGVGDADQLKKIEAMLYGGQYNPNQFLGR